MMPQRAQKGIHLRADLGDRERLERRFSPRFLRIQRIFQLAEFTVFLNRKRKPARGAKQKQQFMYSAHDGQGRAHSLLERRIFPPVSSLADFVCHPLAGTEHSGPESGSAELFDNRWCLLVPVPGTDPTAIKKLRSLWEGLGSNVEEMDPDHHDLVLAVTSHAPHLIAYTMVGVADDLRRVTDSEVIKYSAAGFRDFTRIAASDPTMWRDVFLTNKDATLEILGRFTEELFALQRAIRTGDGDHLHDYFTRTRAIRRGIIEAGQDTAAPDFGRAKKSP